LISGEKQGWIYIVGRETQKPVFAVRPGSYSLARIALTTLLYLSLGRYDESAKLSK